MSGFRIERINRFRLAVLAGMFAATLLPAGGEAGMWPRRLRGHLTITRTCAYSNNLPSPDGDCDWSKTETITITEARLRRVTPPFPVMYLPVSGTLVEDATEYRDCAYVDPYDSSHFCMDNLESYITGNADLGANGQWLDFTTRRGAWNYMFFSPDQTTYLTVFSHDTCQGDTMPVYQEPIPVLFEASGRGRITRTATSFIWNVDKYFTTTGYIEEGGTCVNRIQGRLRGPLR